MANESWVGAGGSSGAPQAATNYMSICGGSNANGSTETIRQSRVKAGVFSHLRFYVNTASAGDVTTVRLRINGANGALVCASTAAATGQFEDVTHTDTVIDDDLVCLSITGNSAPFISVLNGWLGLTYAGTAGTVSFYGQASNTASMNATASRFYPFCGALSFGETTEGLTQAVQRAEGVMSDMRVGVASNSKAGTCTFHLRINGADGNLAVTIPASSTGTFEDAANTDTLASGDLVHWRATSATSGTVSFSMCGATFVSDDGKSDVHGANMSFQSGAQAAKFIGYGGLQALSTTETPTQAKIGFGCVASRLRVRLSQHNTGTGGLTITNRINGAGGNLVVSVPNASSGAFEDVTHTDTIVADDLLCMHISASAGGGYQIDTYAITLDNGGGGGPPPSGARRLIIWGFG